MHASTFEAYRQIAVAPHLHSVFSDGKETIAAVVKRAREAGFQVAWISDHTDFHIEYPLGFISAGFALNSIRERGFPQYLEACRAAQANNPDMLILPGFEAAPFYYWSGSLLGNKMIVHQWMKHLLVAGIEDPKSYARLPMLGYGTSAYRIGRADEGEKPYIDFTGAVRAAGGLAFWAHPARRPREQLVRGNAYSAVTSYAESLLTVPESAGAAMQAVDNIIAKPGGIWDRAILEFTAGKRPVPPWCMVEIDYHSGDFPDKPRLLALLPREVGDEIPFDARETALLDALRAGRFYVSHAPAGELTLDGCTLSAVDGATATLGETLIAPGPVQLTYSITAKYPVEWVQIIRNGVPVVVGTNLTAQWTDLETPAVGATAYYRLAVRGRNRTFLLSNPIFYRQPTAL
ncbi:MAG: PHP domain-containing protein [Armatimonadota bacterium]